jgi:hypothetical protein
MFEFRNPDAVTQINEGDNSLKAMSDQLLNPPYQSPNLRRRVAWPILAQVADSSHRVQLLQDHEN